MTLKELIASIDTTGLSYKEIAAKLNEPTETPNPEPQGVAADYPSTAELQGLVSAQPTAQVDLAALSAVTDLIEDGEILSEYTGLENEGKAIDLVPMLVGYGMSQATGALVEARLQRTRPDPNWQETLQGPSLAEQNGLGRIAAADVMRALA